MATCLVPLKDEAYPLGFLSVTDSTVGCEPKLPTNRAAHNAGYGRGNLEWLVSRLRLVLAVGAGHFEGPLFNNQVTPAEGAVLFIEGGSASDRVSVDLIGVDLA